MSEGLKVLVTAGAAGIGRAIAEAFADRGDQVHVCDVSEDALDALAAEHPGIGTSPADVADPDQVDWLFDAVKASLGGLDVLVNNAGIAGPTGPVDTLSVADWDRTMAVNINGQFYCARRAVPWLRQSKGAIINLSSVAGRLAYPLRTPYAASKWAVVGFTKSLAAELGPEGVRVNAILPGVVDGERIRRVIADRAAAAGVSHEQMEQRYLSQVSLRRMIQPQEIASMATFLCSPAGASISGQALSVCGNVEVLQ